MSNGNSELNEFLEDAAAESTDQQTDQETGQEADQTAETNTETDKAAEEKDASTGDKAAEEKAEEGSTPESETKETGTVPIAALLDEREKRQAFEKQVEELKGKINTSEEQKPLPDVFENQDDFVSELQARLKAETQAVRIEVSQDFMRTMHDDYDQMEAKFMELAKDNPELVSKMSAAATPAKFVYETAKKAEKLAELNNVDEWEAKKTAELTAKIKAELEAEAKAKAETDAKNEDAISPSIAAQRAAGGNNDKSVDVPDPLETTFNR